MLCQDSEVQNSAKTVLNSCKIELFCVNFVVDSKSGDLIKKVLMVNKKVLQTEIT